jgi:hypothetical protein
LIDDICVEIRNTVNTSKGWGGNDSLQRLTAVMPQEQILRTKSKSVSLAKASKALQESQIDF